MAVGLMANIPNQEVFGRIKNIMQRNGQFYNPKAGAQMAFLGGYYFNDEFPKFPS